MEWCPRCQKYVAEISERVPLSKVKIKINKICPKCNLSLISEEVIQEREGKESENKP